MHVEDPQRRAAEQWFRRRGLPTMVRNRPTQLLLRIIPAVVFLATIDVVTDILLLVDGQTDAEFEQMMENDLYAAAYLGLLLSVVVLPPITAWLTMRWVRKRTGTSKYNVFGGIVVALYVLAWPVIEHLAGTGQAILPNLLINGCVVALIYSAASVGGGSIAGWAVRSALRQVRLLGTFTSRALPLLLLFTIFGFFTAEIWQAGTALTRAQMWMVAGFFAVLSVLFMAANLSDEIRELNTVRPSPHGLEKLRDSPFHPFVGDHLPTGEPHVPLRPVERANMMLVLLLTQAFQALVFAVLMFAFFVSFGSLAVRPQVMKAWSAHDPSTGTLFGIQIPVPNELLQVSIFLAAFSALYFVASTTSDARYRQSYFDPLVDHMAVSLTARHIYLTRWRARE
ncbi:hypothetical protein JOF56_007631 [Kibdelosporangium banguiense]|uniref:Uncharacterized protein n=1 Tax=Kibdelosporangium banguiense TaxID=1365924 RepID=A0ABS4TS61_9PSEU|nr:hypothetical protein [Kibdelosporangium banguiense]MBP2327246.1 hypothetical protein [Kibdelosporangium banguiense]